MANFVQAAQRIGLMAAAICFVATLLIGSSSPTASAQETMRDRPVQRHQDGGGGGRGFRTGVGIGVGVGIGSMVIDQLRRQQTQDPRDVPTRSNVTKSRKKKDGSSTNASKKKKKKEPTVAKKRKGGPKTPGNNKDGPTVAKEKTEQPKSSSKKKDEPGLTTTTKEPGPTGRPEEPIEPRKPPTLVTYPLPNLPAKPDCDECNGYWGEVVRYKSIIDEKLKRLAEAEKELEDLKRERARLKGRSNAAAGPIQKAYYEKVIENTDDHIEALNKHFDMMEDLIRAEDEALARWYKLYKECVDKRCPKEITQTSVAPPPPVSATPTPDPPPAVNPPPAPPPTKVAIPKPPEVSAPPNKEQKICGPDITELVLDLLRKIKRQFEDNPDRQGLACRRLIDPKTGGGAWDIYALDPTTAPIKDSSYDPASDTFISPDGGFKIKPWFTSLSNQCAIPRPVCGGTVEFMGTCQHAQVVNYVQWGMMMSLCGGVYSAIGGLAHEAYNLKTYGLGAPGSAQDNMVTVGKEFNEELDNKAGKIINFKDDLIADIRRRLQEREKVTDHAEKNCELVCKLTDKQRKALRDDFSWDFSWSGLTHGNGSRR